MWTKARIVERPDMENVNLLDHGALPLLFEMEQHGIQVDLARLAALDARLIQEKDELSAEIHQLTGNPDFNIASDQQLAHVLFEEMKLDATFIRKTEKTRRPSVKREELEKIAALHPVVRKVIAWNERDDLKSKFVEKIPTLIAQDGRLHTVIKSTRTATGRFATGDKEQGLMSLQNIPVRTKLGQEIRAAFVAGKGCRIIAGDYKQIEMKVVAHVSSDPKLRQVFLDDDDIHWRTAESSLHRLRPVDEDNPQPGELTKDERRRFKAVGFGVVYQITGHGLRNQMVAQGGSPDEWTVENCDGYIAMWHGEYVRVQPMMEMFFQWARRYGYVWDLFGRMMPAVEVKSRNEKTRSKAQREIGNRPIQAGAVGFSKLAMRDIVEVVERYRGKGAVVLPLLQIHDELLFETGEDCADDFAGDLKDVMENVVEKDSFAVPLTADVKSGENWKEAH